MNSHIPALTDRAVHDLLVDSEPYLSCDECFERIDRYVEQRLDDPAYDDPELATHLRACGVCADEARALEELLRDDAGRAQDA